MVREDGESRLRGPIERRLLLCKSRKEGKQ